MLRVGPAQPDLFAPAPAADPPPAPEPPPLDQLAAMLALLRAAEAMPWDGVPAVMAQEQRAMHWARAAGPDGAALASAIMDQIERLFVAEETQQLAAAHAGGAVRP